MTVELVRVQENNPGEVDGDVVVRSYDLGSPLLTERTVDAARCRTGGQNSLDSTLTTSVGAGSGSR